jgi:hypothetical protein
MRKEGKTICAAEVRKGKKQNNQKLAIYRTDFIVTAWNGREK